MLKLKNRKSTLKRYKVTRNNILLHRHAFKGHLLIKKSNKQKRKLSKIHKANLKDKKIIKMMLPYI